MLPSLLSRKQKPHMMIFTLFFCLLSFIRSSAAQTIPEGEHLWTFTTRFTLNGTSHSSAPAGYKIYSSLPFTAGIRYQRYSPLAVEMILSTESREVDQLTDSGEERSLGSIDYLAIVILLQYHLPLSERFHAYAGLGINYNRYFEKSGTVNELGVPDSFGMSGQAGINFELNGYMLIGFDFRVNRMEARLIDNGQELAAIRIDPAALSLDLGFSF